MNIKRKGLTVGALLLCMNLSTFAQSVKLNLKGVSVERAMTELREKSGYSFVFAAADVNTHKVINVNAKDLKQAIGQILDGQNLSYQIKGKNIVVAKGGVKPQHKSNGQQNTKPKKRVNGTIVDEAGMPVIGAAVRQRGTQNATVTDIDGNFTLDATEGADLEVTYIGYEPKNVRVGESDNYKLAMKPASRELNEVVVTALGIKRAEKALSYNVQQVKSDELTRVKDANFVNSLNGKIAGVTINKSGSGVGGSTRVVMRGAKSLEGNNNALYVVDGIPLFNNSMGSDSGIMGEGKAGTEGIADFNPEDIESISVLSGPSAAALYGSSAANGVILINTKKGKEGKLQVTFSSSSEFSKAYMTPEFQNTYGNKRDVYESWGDKLDVPSSYDPKKDFFNTGTNFINSVTLTTGNKTNQTFASISSTNSAGIVPNNEYNRLNITIRNSSSFLKDKLQLDLGASFVKQDDKNMVSQGQYWNPVMAAYLFPRGENFNEMKVFERWDESRRIPVQYWPVSEPTYASQNPYWTAYRNVATNDKRRYMFNFGLTYKIAPWINVAARYRLDDSFVKFQRKIYATSDQKFAEGPKGHYGYSNYNDHQDYADVMANINKNFADFSLSANIGWSYSNYWSEDRGYKGTLLGVTNKFSASNIDPSNGRVSESGGDSHVRNHAAFANVELGWRSMVYLTMTGRNDWNSRLVNTDEESFFYPSVGLSGIISEMVKLPEFISYLKVRGSYTEVGAPISRSGLTPRTVTDPIVGGTLNPRSIYPFTDFKAERTRSYEFGLSFRLWNKLSAEVTYYHSNTKNQTFLGELPEFTGYKQIYLQAGDVENRGWEASLNYSDRLKCGLQISSTVSFSRNVNEIKEMVNDYHTPLMDEAINIPEVLKDKGRTILKKGGSIHDIYANTFLKKDHLGFVEVKTDGSFGVERGEPVYLGKTAPDFNLGWNNSFSYKGFGLSFLINGRFGGVVTSSTEALLDRFGVSKRSAEARDAGGYMIPGQGPVDAKTYFQMIGTGNYETSGYYVYKATNIRLQELTCSYTMPNRWFGGVLKDVTVSFIANNPWMIYCKAPFDPELTPSTSTYGQGNDYFMQPSVRSFGFGVKFKF